MRMCREGITQQMKNPTRTVKYLLGGVIALSLAVPAVAASVYPGMSDTILTVPQPGFYGVLAIGLSIIVCVLKRRNPVKN